MPITPTYPGVYIEEVSSGVRTITGVSTSVAAFIGYTQRGPTNEAVQIFSFGDYERQFGGFHKDSLVSYAVHQFFLNGGSEAWIVRVAAGAAAASVSLKNNVAAPPVVLVVTAKSEGAWGNLLRVEVDYDTANPASLFNLTVTELQDQGGTLSVARAEKHRNLSMSTFSPAFVEGVVNAGSELIEVQRTAPATAYQDDNATSTSGVLGPAELGLLGDDHRRLALTLDGVGPREFDFMQPGDPQPSLTVLASLIEAKAQAAFGVGTITVTVNVGGDRLVATSQTPNGQGEKSMVRFENASIRNAAGVLKLGLANGGEEVEGTASARPSQSGTVGSPLAALDLTTLADPASIGVTLRAPGIPADGPHTLPLWGASPLPPKPSSLEELAGRLQAALASSAKAPLNQAKVSLVASRLQIRAGGTNSNVRLDFSAAMAATLGLDPGVDNVAAYALGSAGLSSQAQVAGSMGTDGTPPTPTLIKGSRALKTGIYALEDVDIFNILCVPHDAPTVSLLGEALAYAAERRAFMIMDFPSSVDSLVEAKQWLNANATLRHKNAAIYFPRIHFADPLEQGRLRPFPTCGAVAGLYARTDASRGVWKAPAGTEARLAGVQKLDVPLTDPENGALNPLAINCLRNFPVYGPVIWGSRTLDGADALASEWKYVPVRRLALFLEESLYRGTKWVVFEPNDEPLWAQIRLNVGAFMHNLFRQGAFQGQTPREAYFVKCDKETTTQTDINLGIVNILVGFAPLKPAEFVIIKIQQIAGQIPT